MQLVQEQYKPYCEKLDKTFNKIEDDFLRLNAIAAAKERISIVDNNEDSIGIGSRFNLDLVQEGYRYNNDYILSESDEPVDGYVVITPKYPLAKAIMGKKESDTVSYDVMSYESKVTINTIYREKVKTI